MSHAICLKCGGQKRGAWESCKECGFTPGDDPDTLVKSVYLSIDRFESEDDRKAYESELDTLADQLRIGETIDFDERDITRLHEKLSLADSVSNKQLVNALVRLFLPGILFLLGLIGVLVLLRFL